MPNKNIQNNSDKALVHAKLARAYIQRNKLTIAKQEADKALQLDENHSVANYVMALLMIKLGENAKASDYFSRAISADPSNASAAHDYGSLLCQTGEKEQAVKQFELAFNNPLFAHPELSYMRAGECLLEIDQLKAEMYLDKALSIDAKLSPALLSLSKIKYNKGEYLSARAYVERYFSAASAQPSVLLLAYQIENALGATLVANEYRDTLLTNFADSKQSKLLRRQLRK